jgi:hypothetical protein
MSSQKRTIEEVRNDLEQARRKLKDVRERGNDAISDYDLSMGYDADFYLNKCPILANHVAYFEEELKELTRDGIQLDLNI